MKITDVINNLEAILSEQGDLEVNINPNLDEHLGVVDFEINDSWEIPYVEILNYKSKYK
jgi:hypothetical protein